jgi:hypothetical protein
MGLFWCGDFGDELVAVVDADGGVSGFDIEGATGVVHADVDVLVGHGDRAARLPSRWETAKRCLRPTGVARCFATEMSAYCPQVRRNVLSLLGRVPHQAGPRSADSQCSGRR